MQHDVRTHPRRNFVMCSSVTGDEHQNPAPTDEGQGEEIVQLHKAGTTGHVFEVRLPICTRDTNASTVHADLVGDAVRHHLRRLTRERRHPSSHVHGALESVARKEAHASQLQVRRRLHPLLHQRNVSHA
eukprot:1334409-Rhodomonas_salina.2